MLFGERLNRFIAVATGGVILRSYYWNQMKWGNEDMSKAKYLWMITN